jgi:hypothetical protein
MIVFELSCEYHHRFEGWFASREAFEVQRSGGQLACPSCSSTNIAAIPSAKIGRPKRSADPAAAPPPPPLPDSRAMLAMLLDHALRDSEDVGARFAEEVRRIHYDEAPQRSIRGVASRQDAVELIEEGIPIMALPMPPKEDWH